MEQKDHISQVGIIVASQYVLHHMMLVLKSCRGRSPARSSGIELMMGQK